MIRTQHEPKLDHRKRVCIVTPGYVSSTPRVVKEADALSQAGYNVRVVFAQGNLERLRRHDDLLLREKPWKSAAVGWSLGRAEEAWLYRKSSLRHHVARRVSAVWPLGKLPEHAEGRVYKELSRLAASEHADLFIGHYPAGLAAAAYAAQHWKARLAYDVEDLHTAETMVGNGGPRQIRRIQIIESRYIGHCSYLSAVSEAVAQEIAKRYLVSMPTVIHNVFPLSERVRIDGLYKDRKNSSCPSAYWYSQTIGEDRGIEDMIRAAGLLRDRIQIHLRGSITTEIRRKLEALARQHGVESCVHFHPQVPPGELLSRAVEHDIGLALEQPINLSRMLSVTNKVFFYLLAGLAIAATDVPGQRGVMLSCRDTGFIYPPGDYHALADGLDELISDPARLRSCKSAALKAAESRWNWEQESRKLVRSVDQTLARSIPAGELKPTVFAPGSEADLSRPRRGMRLKSS